MTRAMPIAVLASAALLGCAVAHSPSDGGRTDAHVDRDAGGPDAWTCADRDGDGATDARCGGGDCDDDDSTLSPTRGPCADPTHAVRCVDEARANVPCPPATPECDARTGECVAAGGACGDGALHASEACDDANGVDMDGCAPDCELGTCPLDTECRVAGAPWCIRVGESTAPVCSPGNPGGLALGERCDDDTQCESGWCGPLDGRCTFFCWNTPHCLERGGWCERGGTLDASTGGFLTPAASFSCVWPCRGPEDCGPDEGCSLAVARIRYPDVETYQGATYCAPIAGTLPMGAPCAAEEECSTNVCYAFECTRVCEMDGDCAELPGTVCTPILPLGRRSPPFPTPYVSRCRRAK